MCFYLRDGTLLSMVHAGLKPMLPGVLAMVEERDKAPSLLIQLAQRSKAVSGVQVHSYCFKWNIVYVILIVPSSITKPIMYARELSATSLLFSSNRDLKHDLLR